MNLKADAVRMVYSNGMASGVEARLNCESFRISHVYNIEVVQAKASLVLS